MGEVALEIAPDPRLQRQVMGLAVAPPQAREDAEDLGVPLRPEDLVMGAEPIRILDRRMALVSRAIFLSVLAAVLTCAVVILLFLANLTGAHFGTAIALLFIASMLAVGLAFGVFLVETRLGSRAVRIRSELLAHEADADE